MSNHPFSPNQIDTAALFSVRQILLSRGFEVIDECDKSKLLLTEKNFRNENWQLLYSIFLSAKLRSELKNFLYHKKNPLSKEVIHLISQPCFIKQYQRFDNTFEWFAGELMIKKFAAFSHSFSVTVKDIQRNTTGTNSGDFDSLVVLWDTNLAYFETKAGSFDSDSITKCYERMLALNCKYSILFCVERINEEKLIWESRSVSIPVTNGHELNRISIKGKENDLIYEINNCYFVDMSGNIEDKIRTVLRANSAKINSLHNSMTPDNDTYNLLGYNFDTINNVRYENR